MSHFARSAIYRALAITPVGVENPAPVLYELVGDSTEIGSAEDNAIVLADTTVAPHHIAVRRNGEQEYILVDLAARRRARDLVWCKNEPGDAYWCPRDGSIPALDGSGRCPVCRRKRGSLWLLRPIAPGNSFDIGRAFRATLVVKRRNGSGSKMSGTNGGVVHAQQPVFPPNDLFAPHPPSGRISMAPTESAPTGSAPTESAPTGLAPTTAGIAVRELPTDDSNLWQWQPENVPFPIFLHQRVNRLITAHARENSEREVGGILLGDVCYDPQANMYLVITDALKAEFATETRGHLTFTQMTWLKLHQAREAKFPNKTIVGWYHTHPGWTIFLSDWDLFIHRNFFKEPWQIALVLDPSLDQAGFFVWRGKEISDPQEPIGRFRLIELDDWAGLRRPRIRIKLTDHARTQ